MPDTLGYRSEAFYEHMQMMRDGLGTAIEQIITAGLDHLTMGIALETFWGGVAQAEKFQYDLARRAGRRHYHRFTGYRGCSEEVWSRQYCNSDSATAAR